MKKRRLLSLFLSFALLIPLFGLTQADAYEDFDLDAKAGLLIEADTGEILYEKNAHQENYPASLTKVMVALLALRRSTGESFPSPTPSPRRRRRSTAFRATAARRTSSPARR